MEPELLGPAAGAGHATWSESIDPQEFYQLVQLGEVVPGLSSRLPTTSDGQTVSELSARLHQEASLCSLTVQRPAPASSESGPAGSLRGVPNQRRPGSAAGPGSGHTGLPGRGGAGGFRGPEEHQENHDMQNVRKC